MAKRWSLKLGSEKRFKTMDTPNLPSLDYATRLQKKVFQGNIKEDWRDKVWLFIFQSRKNHKDKNSNLIAP